MIKSLVFGIAVVHGLASGATFFDVNMTHAQEVSGGTTPTLTSTGDPRPLSHGTATFTLNDAQTELSMVAIVYDIDITSSQTADNFDNLVAAHIHVGGGLGTNASVRWGFFGSPDNDTLPDNLVVTPFATGTGGTISSIWNAGEGNSGTVLADSLPTILEGFSYLNFHTVQFGGGEIRGQLNLVPEPSTLGLLGMAAAGLMLGRRKAK